MSGTRFRDRAHAGRLLSGALQHLAGRSDLTVLALPRGGVPVAHEVAAALRAPLDVVLVRKLGVPGHPELAMGAIADGGVQVLNHPVIDTLGVDTDLLAEVVVREQAELDRRALAYRGDRPTLDAAGRVAVVVDDGLATGSTMRAALAVVRAHLPLRVVAAVPVGAADACRELAGEADEVACLFTPTSFRAVSQWYDDFSPPSDEEIRLLLAGGDEVA